MMKLNDLNVFLVLHFKPPCWSSMIMLLVSFKLILSKSLDLGSD